MTKSKEQEDILCSIEPNSLNTQKTEEDENTKDLSSSKEIGSKTDPQNHSQEIEESSPESGFEGFGFSKELLQTLDNKGYKQPTPIQKAAFPELMLGRDLVGQAQTGTGKTAAFALPIIEKLSKPGGPPQVLVLTPTRELAIQVAESFKTYAEDKPDLKILSVYGGADFRSQINALKRGVAIIVGTPGRVMDHLRQGTINKTELNCLVLDEADEMLRMGFIDDVEWILEQLYISDVLGLSFVYLL